MAAARQHAHLTKTLRHYHADPYCENKVLWNSKYSCNDEDVMSFLQEGKTALELGQDGDDVKEALLSHRFTGEVVPFPLALHLFPLSH